MLDQLTIVIITYKRYPFLKRLLKFFESYQLKAQFLVLDSSPKWPVDEELKELLDVDHLTWKRYDPSILYSDKIAEGCKHIDTEYVVLCADDDFLIPTVVTACVDFLAENPDYASAHGLYFSHNRGSQGRKIYIRISPLYEKGQSSEEKTGSERVQAYLDGQTGSNPMYAVHRTSIFRIIWNETAKYVTDWGLHELFPCSLSFAYGKMKILPEFYASREPNTFEWYDEKRQLKMYSEEKLGRAVKGLGRHLSKVDGFPLKEAERLGRDAFDIYLVKARKKYEKIKSGNNSDFIKYLKQIKGKLKIRGRAIALVHYLRYQGCHPSIYPKYLEDFKRVSEAVLSAGLTAEELNKARVEQD